MAVEPTLRRFTIDEYYQLVQAGILKEDDRVELIEGNIVQMSPIGPAHVVAVIRLNRVLCSRLLDRADVSVQSPVRLRDQSLPEPDFAVIRQIASTPGPAATALPDGADVYLLVEIADSSLETDLGWKARLYARNGIADYWVLDLPGDRLVVHRQPGPEGYASVVELRRGATVSPLAFPRVTLAVDEMLG